MIRDDIPPPDATKIPFLKKSRRLLASSAEEETAVEGCTAAAGGNVNALVAVVNNATTIAAMNGSIRSCGQLTKQTFQNNLSSTKPKLLQRKLACCLDQLYVVCCLPLLLLIVTTEVCVNFFDGTYTGSTCTRYQRSTYVTHILT